VPAPFEHFYQVGFLPFGRRLVIVANQSGQGTRLFVQDLSGAAPRAISPEGIVPGLPLLPVSADEKWVAATASDLQVHLYAIDGSPPRSVAGSTAGMVPIRLSESGGHLYLFAARLDQVPTHIRKIDVADGTQADWATITPAEAAGIHGLPSVLLSADGKALAYSYARFLSEMYLITGVR
jgi:hypothetical protein